MKVCWLSGGVSSFVAGYLVKDQVDKFIYIDIDDQHPDTLRFIEECQDILGKKTEILKSPYGSVENVIRQFRFINSPYGAKCTQILKKRVRKEWEQGKGRLTYVWGFDHNEKGRAQRLEETMEEHDHVFPLIERHLKKEEAHGVLRELGINRPVMYNLGYHNNNCVGCVKGGMGYWNKIRQDFPEVFINMSRLEREIGATCIKGVYLDELDPKRGRHDKEVLEDCSIVCQINL